MSADVLIRAGGGAAQEDVSAAAAVAGAGGAGGTSPVSWAWPGAAPGIGTARGALAIAKGMPLPPATPGSGAGSGPDSGSDFGSSGFAREGGSGDRRSKRGAAAGVAAAAAGARGGGGRGGGEAEDQEMNPWRARNLPGGPGEGDDMSSSSRQRSSVPPRPVRR